MRIISGTRRGRKILPPDGMTTRPITDRVKESLLASLTPWVPGASVLDLFCGTGSLGLEALSRGADGCRFADADRGALTRLRQNIDALELADRSTIWPGDILAGLEARLETLDRPVDLVFLDPPYPLSRRWQAEPDAGRRARDRLFAPLGSAMAPDAVAVLRIQREAPEPDYIQPLVCARRREYGTMALNFLQRPDAPDHDDA